MNKSDRRCKYTPEIIEFIRSSVKEYTEKEIANLINEKWNLNVNDSGISNIKSKYGIKTGFGRGQFVKGQQSWNKGKKTKTIGRMAETQFKKGGFSPNRVPIGSERFTKDGYLQIKIKDGCQNNNWIVKHRLIWEQHFGPIPPKHRVVFLDGDKSNLDITNLALMSYGQTAIMSKKNLFYKDPMLTKIGSNIAKIELISNQKKRGKSSV